MMRPFYNTTLQVQVNNVLIRSGVSQKYSFEVMAVQLGPTFAGLFDADMGAKHFEMSNIRLNTKYAFERGFSGGGVDHTIVKIYRM